MALNNFLMTLLTLTALLSCALAQGGPTTIPLTRGNANLKACRFYAGMSRCVDGPVPTAFVGKWCPYHMCGPSYVRARKCARGERKATHYCKKERVVERMWQCMKGVASREVDSPIGCRGNGARKCTGHIPVCSCWKERVVRRVYTFDHPKVFTCRERRR